MEEKRYDAMMEVRSNATHIETQPYFSIILPIYNVEPYLEQCIQSVLQQDFFDYELILVNDGSTDGSGGVCDAYAAEKSNIRVVHKENGGLSSARNAGTEAARGRYIWWVDSDDWIEPGALRELYDVTCREEPDIVKFHFFRVGEEKKPVSCRAQSGVYTDRKQLEILVDKCFLSPGIFCLSAWGHVYARRFLDENSLSFVSERVIGSEDYLFQLCAYAAAKKICVLDSYLYCYRLRSGSLTQRYREQLPLKYTELFHQLLSYFSKRGSLQEYEKRICHFYVWHLLHGTCLGNEYKDLDNHSIAEGRRNIRNFLRKKEVSYAVRHCEKKGFSFRQKVQLYAMRLGAEPIFYWLFVKKHQAKKDAHYED